MRHNIGVISRLFIGSVTRYCVEKSDAPVTIVPSIVADAKLKFRNVPRIAVGQVQSSSLQFRDLKAKWVKFYL